MEWQLLRLVGGDQACGDRMREKGAVVDDIVRMVKMGIRPAINIDAIRTTPTVSFTATAEDRADLEHQGVPREVTAAMLARMYEGSTLPPTEKAARKKGSEVRVPATVVEEPVDPAPSTAPSATAK